MRDGWVCPGCGYYSWDGKRHAPDCWNHPQRELIALKRRVAALEADSAHAPRSVRGCASSGPLTGNRGAP